MLACFKRCLGLSCYKAPMTKAKQLLLTILFLGVLLNSNARIVLSGAPAAPLGADADTNDIVALANYFEKVAGLGFSGAVLVV